ncbi:putative bifunctional diguanylate cyclase/phosphodiesterase [Arvimicrobium flavum]|uniref:putative bifunctional diguanylate cyclase/phosphodiesterase n=1 Tax=Arvimicrobium flavum TaxID=3393320 RepID=UPI00237C368E|nr:bifunctional diguanylate cyclase/phosphodiesterase [Mesorhizobium shangrilense]
MPQFKNPHRSTLFRLTTIAACGIGSLAMGMWGLQIAFGSNATFIPAETAGAIIAALFVLGSSCAALAFFAGVDESLQYVHQETQLDKLTGLHSRRAMIGRVATAGATTERTGESVFLIDVDIDRFKQINEAIGYGQGDELIRTFARRLQDALPRNAEIGRLGAGEFGILIKDDEIDLPIEAFVQALIDRLMEPYQLATHLQSVNVSLGLAAVTGDGDDPVQVLRCSSLALQHARATGLGGWAIFHPDMGRVADHRQWVESELHTAFERGDFHLHYQPQLDLQSGKTVGYEALIRWKHPERGMIPPNEFIPIAEETGMIFPIGSWVLRKACSDARLLPDDCFVAVNISPVQFMTRDFLTVVRQAIQATGIAPSRLELEVTETAMMQDRERAAVVLKELAGMGISVAVDDFGTGYSNLSYLIDFPFRKLKIDRSFVSRMETDSNSGAVVSTIVGLSRALGVRTIAEGVETESQATLLKAAGCEVVQGYFFGRPGPLQLRDSAETAAAASATMH